MFNVSIFSCPLVRFYRTFVIKSFTATLVFKLWQKIGILHVLVTRRIVLKVQIRNVLHLNINTMAYDSFDNESLFQILMAMTVNSLGVWKVYLTFKL